MKSSAEPVWRPAHPHGRGQPRVPVRVWRTVKSIFYASAPSWQVVKSGALLFFGFFCWSAANLLLSYQPAWTVLYYVMAYGFLLTWYGPLTHLVLVPHVIPWLRRRTRWGTLHRLGRHLTTVILTLFFSSVLLLGIRPPDVMVFDFRSMTAASHTTDVNPTLACTRDPTGSTSTIECRLDEATHVGAITVESGERHLLTRHSRDFAFSLQEDHLVEVVGHRQFQVIVRTPEGEEVRRFTRTVSMIENRSH